MRKILTYLLLVITTQSVFAQVNESIAFIKLNNNVGFVIDSIENNHYNCIANANKNLFRHAILIQRADSFVELKIKELHRTGYRNEIMTRYSLQKMHGAVTKVKSKTEPAISEENEKQLLKNYASSANFTLIDYEQVQMPSYFYKKQNSDYFNEVIYETWIELMDGSGIIHGALYELKDSSIILATSTKQKDFKAKEFSLVKIDAGNIKKIKLRDADAKWIGLTIGASSGLATGAILGYAEGTTTAFMDPDGEITASEKAIRKGIPGMLGGGLAGYIAGTIIKKKFEVDGNLFTYQKLKLKLGKYSIVKN